MNQQPQVIVVQNKNSEGCFGCLWAVFWFVLVAAAVAALGAVVFCVARR